MEKNFETAMLRLEEISKLMADDKITIEESLELYSEGVKLIAFCNKKLQTIHSKIEEIDNSLNEDR